MDLFIKINELCEELNKKTDEIIYNGKVYADAYRNYRILLAKKITQLKINKMPATLIHDLARGSEEVAQAKFEEISKEAIYKANLESINTLKIQIKVLQEQTNKEW